MATRIWRSLLPNENTIGFFSLNLQDWILCNLRNTWNFNVNNDWPCTFGVMIWQLWNWRNKVIFSNSTSCCRSIIHDVSIRVAEIQRVYLAIKPADVAQIEKRISWSPPASPAFKLNMDGSCKSSEMAGVWT